MKINRKENDTRLNGKEKGEGRIGQDHRLPDSEGMAHTGAPKSDSEQHSIEEGREFDRETILRDEQADPEVRDIWRNCQEQRRPKHTKYDRKRTDQCSLQVTGCHRAWLRT